MRCFIYYYQLPSTIVLCTYVFKQFKLQLFLKCERTSYWICFNVVFFLWVKGRILCNFCLLLLYFGQFYLKTRYITIKHKLYKYKKPYVWRTSNSIKDNFDLYSSSFYSCPVCLMCEGSRSKSDLLDSYNLDLTVIGEKVNVGVLKTS